MVWIDERRGFLFRFVLMLEMGGIEYVLLSACGLCGILELGMLLIKKMGRAR
jgi:hypothetical protein